MRSPSSIAVATGWVRLVCPCTVFSLLNAVDTVERTILKPLNYGATRITFSTGDWKENTPQPNSGQESQSTRISGRFGGRVWCPSIVWSGRLQSA